MAIKNWSLGHDWETTLENFTEQHFNKAASGRLMQRLVDRGIFNENDISYIYGREIEFKKLAPEGCLKIWEI